MPRMYRNKPHRPKKYLRACEIRIAKDAKFFHADNDDFDQSARTRRPI